MKNKPVHFLVGALVFLWSVTTLSAQDQAPAPSFRDGDTWQFNVSAEGRIASSTEQLLGIYELVFSQAHLKVYAVNGNQKTEMDIKSKGPVSILSTLIGINKERQSLKFPLSIGHKWTYEYIFEPPGASEQTRSAEVTVTGLEQVTTPAGSFKAYKLVSNEQWQGGRRGGAQRSATVTYFYSPDTRSVVKLRRVTDPQQSTAAYELIKFTPGK